jgi:predicted Zn finger-like uncharacterized protein
MSLITRCPNCETLFKVVPDQLRVSEGWVRCGQCEEIFDASANLQQALPEEPVPATEPTPSMLPAEEPSDHFEVPVEAEAEPEAAPQEPVLEHDNGLHETLDEEYSQAPDHEPELQQPSEGEDESDAGRPDIEDIEDELDVHEDVQEIQDVLEVVPEHPSAPLEPVFVHGLSPRGIRSQHPTDVSFMRKSHRHSVWRRPLVRMLLLLLSMGLLLALMAQVLVHERDRIVATEPASKPWVEKVCSWLGCTVSPLQQIEAMVIDSSSFNKVRGDTYRLNFTLKNSVLTELATPAIELTLTDIQDRPVMRRVFTHAEVGIASPILAPAAEANGTLTVSVKPVANTERIAGYRVLAFYP